MSYQLGKEDTEAYVNNKKIFAKEASEKDVLFTIEDSMYKLTIKDHKDDEIEIYEENILGDKDPVNLDNCPDSSINEINFRKVIEICPEAFDKLESNRADLIFIFESETIKIRPNAFGDNFQKLEEIKGLNEEQISLILFKDSFKNEGVLKNLKTLNNMDLYLRGSGWTKELIEHLIEIKDGTGKIRCKEDFEINKENLFIESELDDTKLDKLSKEFAQKISLNKEVTEKAKAIRSEAKKKEKDAKRAKGEIVPVGWKDLKVETKEEVIKEMITQFNAKKVFARVELDESVLKLTDTGEIIVTKGSIKKVGFVGSTLEVTSEIFKKTYDNNKLKNNKENKDKARQFAKDKIKEYFEKDTVIGEKDNLTGPHGISCKFVLSYETLKEKFKDREIKIGKNIVSIDKENIGLKLGSIQESLNKINDLREKSKNNGQEKIFVSGEFLDELYEEIKVIGKHYKHSNTSILQQCVKAIKVIDNIKKNQTLKDGE